MSARSSSRASSHHSRRSFDGTSESKGNHTIQLVDHTVENDEAGSPSSGPATPVARTRSSDLTLRLDKSLRQQLTERKYAKWREAHEQLEDGVMRAEQQHTSDNAASAAQRSQEPQAGELPQQLPQEQSRFRRGRSRIKSFLNPRFSAIDSKSSHAIDILYENQRGTFFFGIPFFSSNSLFQFDPPAWQNAQFHLSPVDITNAQVPDPSWEWDWARWYVDMSRDVDEEGWQYSFKFGSRWSWHGTNPWWCSFVRRRRWLRRRVRVNTISSGKGNGTPGETMSTAHKFNAEYFTIHTAKEKSTSPLGKEDEERVPPAAWRGRAEEDEDADIRNIATLMLVLRKANVDRQKIVAVQHFIDQGGEELFYLADEMPHILSLLVYQSSRRQLLSICLNRIDKLHHEAHEEQTHTDEEDPEKTKRELDYLHRALDVADQQVKRLEYWSDITRMAKQGDTARTGWDPQWQGVDTSGADVLKQNIGLEHGSEDDKADDEVVKEDKGKGKELA